MAKPPPAFDKNVVRQDSQVIPVPRVNVPMPKAATPAASQSSAVNPASSQKTGTKPTQVPDQNQRETEREELGRLRRDDREFRLEK